MELINGHTAAEILGITEHQLRVWRMQSKGPAYVKIGWAVRYYLNDLKAWVDAQRIIPE